MPGTGKEGQICPIPGPRALPIIGNLLDIDLENGTMSFLELAKRYYPIFKVTFAGQTSIVINSVALTSELCDETRFHKHVSSSLEALRAGTNDGLFTARDDEKNWQLAHRLLVPAFGPLRIRAMFPEMCDIAQQLCLKWQRYGSKRPLNLTDDFTRATLDTIALCAMGYRFNSFYFEGDFHPFVNSMVRFLQEADMQATLPSALNCFRPRAKKSLKLDVEVMRRICQDLIKDRRGSNSRTRNDLLDTMMNARDTVSGEAMTDESIIDNILTFLVAGHETTSGLLSFALYYLLKHPNAMAKATDEVDRVVGGQELTVEHLSKLRYLTAVLREALRLMPTAPGFSVTPYKKEIIGGKFEVSPGDSVDIFLAAVHRDPDVYGPDPDDFRPERMLDEDFQKLPVNAWKPFGNGKRGCIGRAFAWQEALIILVLCLQNFSMSLVDKDYDLQLKETLTIKPDNLWAHATPRPGREILKSSLLAASTVPPSSEAFAARTASEASIPATILYGSNSGTCEALAHRLGSILNSKKPLRCQVKDMDASIKDELPKSEPVIIITGSYDGRPPANAAQFVDWLTGIEGEVLQGITYAVFGCGHRDWTVTFHRIPTLVDTLLEEHGAKRIAQRGSVDTAEQDPFAELESWTEKELLPALEETVDFSRDCILSTRRDTVRVDIRPPHSLRAEYDPAVVQLVQVLTSPGTSKKIHVEIALPDHLKYEAGDHLAILPLNSRQNVQRVLSHFRMGEDSIVYVTSGSATSLPTDTQISVADLLSGYVELGQVATPLSLKALAAKAMDTATAEKLLRLAGDEYIPHVRENRLSLIDVLGQLSLSSVTFEDYLQMLAPIRARLYTISSSPRSKPGRASLTISIVDEPRRGTAGHHRGVASNHLLDCVPGTILRVSLRHPSPDFRLPPPSSSRPIIMVASGSGIAPFRAFIQERATRNPTGIPRAPAMLFFGCRDPCLDDLYRDELDAFASQNVVTVFRAFSRAPDHSSGCRYVQDLLWMEQSTVKRLWEQGARIFVCGGTKMNEGVKQALSKVVSCSPDEFHGPRYVAEVFL
ncbi:cytochrome P450 [Aspergillus indologenus CBS 114.80]|uniref:Bifunctional cytochrome P450/NADPH--P450 reductase n=1 Tax=Aspergillus indologenus CBS 114.80 TaxID=1450541 RepID=A0A2V5I010_9EURO|nr:cytochrome P450 [Aspergillus indologenus CBS 114.80]